MTRAYGIGIIIPYEESCHRDYYPIWMSGDCYPTSISHATRVYIHDAEGTTKSKAIYRVAMTHRMPYLHRLGCLIFTGHFPQKSPVISGSFANNDLQLGAPPPAARPGIIRVFAALYWQTCVCDFTQSCVRHDAFVYVTWLRRVWEMTRSSVWHDSFVCVTWLVVHEWDTTHSCMWHDSVVYVAWLIRLCDMTHSSVWHDASFMYETWRIRDMTHSYMWHDSFMQEKWLIRDMAYSYMWSDSSMHSYMWHDSSTHDFGI